MQNRKAEQKGEKQQILGTCRAAKSMGELKTGPRIPTQNESSNIGTTIVDSQMDILLQRQIKAACENSRNGHRGKQR